MAQVLAEAETAPIKSGTPYSNCMQGASSGLSFLRRAVYEVAISAAIRRIVFGGTSRQPCSSAGL